MQGKAVAPAPVSEPETPKPVEVPRDAEKPVVLADGSKAGVLTAWTAREKAFTAAFTAAQKVKQSAFFTTQRSFTACVKQAVLNGATRETILTWDKSERFQTAVGKILKAGCPNEGRKAREFTKQEAERWVSLVGECGDVDKAVKFCQLICRMKLAGKLSE